jgi:membrane protease YdiL (CAAX protease family)
MSVRHPASTKRANHGASGSRSVAFVVFVVIAIALAYAIAGGVATRLGWSQESLLALANGILAVAGGVALWRRGGLAGAGIEPRPWRRALALSTPLFLPAAVTLVLALVFGGAWSAPGVATYVGLALLVGLAEELQFRGLIYGALRRFGATRGVVISAALFGLLHTMNIARGAGVAGSLLQVVYAFAFGCAFAAALELGGRLAPLIAAHALTDLFAYLAGQGATYAGGHDALIGAVTVAYVLVLGGYAWWLLRRVPRRAAVPPGSAQA